MGRLDGISLLEPLTEDERAELEKRCQWRRYAKGDEVVTRNSDSRDLFMITEGAVDIIKLIGNSSLSVRRNPANI